MGLKISSSSLFTRRFLKVKKDRIRFYEPGMFLGARSFPFRMIDCVLVSPTNVLSFQVGREVFSIPTQPGKAKHQQTIAAFIAGVEGSRLPAGSAVRYDSTP